MLRHNIPPLSEATRGEEIDVRGGGLAKKSVVILHRVSQCHLLWWSAGREEP